MDKKEISNIGPFNSIGSKIFGIESYHEIIGPLIIANTTSNLFPENKTRVDKREHLNLNIDFIALLLNDEFKLSNLFWDTFSIIQSNNIDQRFDFSLDEIIQLLELTRDNKDKIINGDKLYESLKLFISSNALLSQASNTHINAEELTKIPEFKGHASIAHSYLADTTKYALINKAKSTLLKSLFLIEGYTLSSKHPYLKYIDSSHSPSDENLNLLMKHKMIKRPSKHTEEYYKSMINKTEEGNIEYNNEETYIAYAELAIIELRKLLNIFQSAKAGSAQTLDFNLSERLEFNSVLKIALKENTEFSSIIDFLDQNSKKLTNSYLLACKKVRENQKGGALDYLQRQKELEAEDLDALQEFDTCMLFITAINYLINSLEARINLLKNSSITARELELVAKLETYRTVLNDYTRDSKDKKSPLKKLPGQRDRATEFTSESGREWLKSNRKNTFELRTSLEIKDKVNIEDIKNVYRSLNEDLS